MDGQIWMEYAQSRSHGATMERWRGHTGQTPGARRHRAALSHSHRTISSFSTLFIFLTLEYLYSFNCWHFRGRGTTRTRSRTARRAAARAARARQWQTPPSADGRPRARPRGARARRDRACGANHRQSRAMGKVILRSNPCNNPESDPSIKINLWTCTHPRLRTGFQRG